MNEESCDIHDVVKSASDLVSLGCTLGATHFDDGIIQSKFSAVVSSYANGVIQAVEEGAISALQGVLEIKRESAELLEKAFFYAQNGIGILGGAMQVEAGVAVTAGTRGIGTVYGGMLIAHGSNNIYEGFGNIYNGPDSPGVTGPVRQFYQDTLEDTYRGDMAYYTMDLLLSGKAMMTKVRKSESVELFSKDPINYQWNYEKTGKIALFFEAIVDFFTIRSMLRVKDSEK